MDLQRQHEEEQQPRVIAGGACCCLISCVILGFMSMQAVSPLEYGLRFNRITYTLGDTNGGGRYFIGPHVNFILFPATAQTLDFSGSGRTASLRSRTSDGLEVKIELSLQYQFAREDVRVMYEKFGPKYEEVYRRLTIDTITRQATEYTSTFIFTQRPTVQREFQGNLSTIYRTEAFTNLNTFQLLKVELPKEFEDAITLTETRRQDALKAIQEEATKRVEGQTLVNKAEQDQRGIVIRGEAAATSIMLNNAAYVEQFNITQRLAAASYEGVLEMLENNEDNLMEYLRMRAMRDHKPANSIISMANRNLGGGGMPTPAPTEL